MRKQVLCAFVFLALNLSFSQAEENIDELINYSKKQEEAVVTQVNATDYVTLEDGRRIHLIGIEREGNYKPKYPKRDKNGMIIEEKVDASTSPEEQALVFAQELLKGKRVRLEFDVDATDMEGKKEAYVFLMDGRLANAELLRQGVVNLRIRPPNVKYAQLLRDAYQEAKKEQRGYRSN